MAFFFMRRWMDGLGRYHGLGGHWAVMVGYLIQHRNYHQHELHDCLLDQCSIIILFLLAKSPPRYTCSVASSADNPLSLPSKSRCIVIAATPWNSIAVPHNAIKCIVCVSSFLVGSLDEQNGVQAPVVFGIVGDLCIPTPNDLSSSSH